MESSTGTQAVDQYSYDIAKANNVLPRFYDPFEEAFQIYPWIPSPEDLEAYQEELFASPDWDSVLAAWQEETPSASTDMTCKPQPRYGWRG